MMCLRDILNIMLMFLVFKYPLIIIFYLVHLLGIELPVNMMFFFGFCFTLLLLFILTVKVSKQEEQLKRLTQELALLEDRMNSRRLDKSICREANQMKGETCKKKDE